MRFARIRYLGREITGTAARLERADGQWRGTLDGPLVTGAVSWDPAGRGRLTARLARFAIPEARPQGQVAQPQVQGQDPPAPDLVAERFDFRGRRLGKPELKAE